MAMTSPFPKNTLPLGFGCARLHAGSDKAHSLRLLETAYDAGIRYFDTARLYALGEAEAVLGEFAANRRNDILITSKAGILPAPNGVALKWARRAAKLASLAMPALRPKPLEPRFGAFTPVELRHSVETSLRKLRIECLDGLLLHEIDESDFADGAVLDTLEALKASGKIATYGIASTPQQTIPIVARYGAQLSIVQIASTVFEDTLGKLGDQPPFYTITHSVLAAALDRFAKKLQNNGEFRARWIAEIGTDPSDRETIAALLLAEAVDANKQGLVLFSSASPMRIQAAARLIRERLYTPDQITGLRRIVKG